MDLDTLREKMVDEQLVARGIRDKKVLDAFRRVKRHLFVPRNSISDAYLDCPVSIGFGQTISQPYMVALMTECLDLHGDERVLEVGSGSGYQSAILSCLAKEVFTVERIEELAKQAEEVFLEQGYTSIRLKLADGSLGWKEEAPFDRIIVTAASPAIPDPLLEQMRDPGKMVLPLGESYSQMLTIVEKIKGEFRTKNVCGCVFVPLIGEFGND